MHKPMWRLQESSDNPQVLELYIYGDVTDLEINWETFTIRESENSANHFREELAAHPDVTEIRVYINSYGGDVFEGTAIYNQLRRHPAHKTVYVDGFACSIASVIAMAGDTVVMPRNTLMMIHNMWCYAVGNPAMLRKQADDLDIINAAGRQAYLDKAGDKLSEDELVRLMDAESWLTAEDCVRLGLADQLADKAADMTGATAAMEKLNAGLEQHIQLSQSLTARLRELTQVPNATPTPTPAPIETSDPSACNSILQLFKNI